jgi:nucleoside-diphosphate-sugar epimerase
VVPVPAAASALLFATTEAAARLTRRATLLTRDKGRELTARAWICDPSRLTELTGWRAEHPLSSGARLTLDWYRRAGWL